MPSRYNAAKLLLRRPREYLAVGSKLLAMLLGLALALSTTSAGTWGVEVARDGTSLRDSPREAQARSQSSPEQSPLRLCECQENAEGEREVDGDGDMEMLAITEALVLHDTKRRWIILVDHASEAAQRVQAGHGARGPPIA